MRAKTIAAILASAAFMVLSMPGGASAHSGSANGPAKRGSAGTFTIVAQEFELHGSNGYEIEVELEDRQGLSIEAFNSNLKNHSSGHVTHHLNAPQQLGSDDIRARLGNLGRIDFHFLTEAFEDVGNEGLPSDPAGEAIVNPPSPFSGSATFRRESPKESKWSGDLKVDLPGFGTVPLTGHGAQATLCVSECAKELFSLRRAAGGLATR